jgi:hypothetical protein
MARNVQRRVQKTRMQKWPVKTTLTTFLCKGIIHHKYVPEKQAVNGKCYKEVIKD